MNKRFPILITVALLLLSGCNWNDNQGGTTPSRPVLDSLQCPSAVQIQQGAEPPYGPPPTTVPAPGNVTPQSTKLAEEKGLASGDELNADYATVQNMYKAILLPWLVDKLGLASYDAQLAQQGIAAAPEEQMPFALYAQRYAGVDLSYLYIRNNFFVERLTQDHINLFLDHADDPSFASDPDLNQIVSATYPDVIKFLDTDDVLTGFDMSGDLFDNDAVVVELVYHVADNEMDENGRFNQLHTDRYTFIRDTIVPALEKDLPLRWDGHVSLFWEMV